MKNNSIKENEKFLKRALKKKIGFSMGMLVSFMITGGVGYSEVIVNDKDYIIDSSTNDNNFVYISNGDTYTNNGSISYLDKIGAIIMSNSSTVINGENGVLFIKVPETHSSNSNTAQGIYAQDSVVINDGKIIIEGVENSNNHQTNGTGIRAYGKSNVTNNGEIKITGSQGSGIGSDGGIVINGVNGSIIVEGSSGASGILLSDQYGMNREPIPESGADGKNYGTILVTGNDSYGVMVQRNSRFANDGNIFTSGENTIGIGYNQNSIGENLKNIETTGVGGLGVSISNSRFINGETGTIKTNGNYSKGVSVFDDSKAENDGTILTTGLNGHGVSMGNSEFINRENGKIITTGDNAVGLVLNYGSIARNDGMITTNGISAMGVLLLGNSEFENLGSINVNGDAYNNNNVNSGIDVQGTAIGYNSGTINTTGRGAFGMRNNGIAVNTKKGTIITEGQNGVGIYSRTDNENDEGIAINLGKIITRGRNSQGMNLDRNSVGINDGLLETHEKDSMGMRVRNGSTGINSGTIATYGEAARGMNLRSGGYAENFGTITTTGAKARGIDVSGKNSKAINQKKAKIETIGEFAYGMRATNSGQVINNGDIITGDKKDATKGRRAYGIHISEYLYLGEVNSAEEVMTDVIYDVKNYIPKDRSYAENNGTIETYGNDTYGMSIINGTAGINTGDVITSGDRAFGIYATYGSKVENFGDIQTTGEEARGVSLISDTYRADEIEYYTGDTDELKEVISTTNIGTIFINHAGSEIRTKGDRAYGVYLESNFATEKTIELAERLGVELTEVEVAKSKFDNFGAIETHGDGAYGIYSSNSIVNNSGNIHTRGKGAYGIYAINGSEINHTGKIHVNDPRAYGIAYDSTSTINISRNSEIKVDGQGANAIHMIDGGTMALNTKELPKSHIVNNGDISIIGEGATGFVIKGAGEAENRGTIDISGTNSIGMYAEGVDATITNKGTILLNIADSSTAMMGRKGALVNNNGIVKLKDIAEDNIEESRFSSLLSVDSESKLQNTGIVVNKNDKIVLASGDKIEESEIENVEKDEILKADDSVIVTGTSLAGTINQGENFKEEVGKYLLKIENSESELEISGTINAGKNAVEIGKDSQVILTGNINSMENALSLNGSIFKADGASINGNILLNGEENSLNLSKTEMEGDIVSDSTANNSITIENSTSIKGDILLGMGDDNVIIDSTSANLLRGEMVIDGGSGKDSITVGTLEETTIVRGILKNFEVNSFKGDVLLSSEAKILGDNTKSQSGDIVIEKNSNLVLDVNLQGEHALSSISGNTISSEENGKLYVRTENISTDKDGKYILDMKGTDVLLSEENINATQFVYDIDLESSSKLNISLKSLENMGLDSKYQGIFDSIVSSGNLNGLNSTLLGNQSEFEKLLSQVSEKNIYPLGTKLSRDSAMIWSKTLSSVNGVPALGEWKAYGTILGEKSKNESSLEHKSYFNGVLTGSEYGLNYDLVLGITFAGGKQKGELSGNASEIKGDSFYTGVYGKKSLRNYRFLGALGYQRNNYDSTRILENGVDSFKFEEKFNTDTISLLGEVRYSLEMENGIKLEPRVTMNYIMVSQDAVDEGDSTMAMKVNKQRENTVESEIGLDFSKEVKIFDSTSGKIYTGISYSYLAGDTDKNLTGEIGEGKSFEIQGTKADKNIGKVHIGAEFQTEKGFNYSIGASYKIGENSSSEAVKLGIGYKF